MWITFTNVKEFNKFVRNLISFTNVKLNLTNYLFKFDKLTY